MNTIYAYGYNFIITLDVRTFVGAGIVAIIILFAIEIFAHLKQEPEEAILACIVPTILLVIWIIINAAGSSISVIIQIIVGMLLNIAVEVGRRWYDRWHHRS